jgi:glc operon protein GlcG
MNARRFTPVLAIAAFAASTVLAQVPQYGPNVTLEQARKVAAAAEAESKKNGWPMAIAIVDTAGQLVYYQRMDNTQTGSVQVSIDKATTAAMFRRPTKAIQDAIAAGGPGLRFLGLHGATPIEGGLPITVDGKIIGAIGVSGMASDQDGTIAKTGADAAK